ncbi:hypothetical protein ACTFIU_008382 [Dictyostelium citrinum]
MSSSNTQTVPPQAPSNPSQPPVQPPSKPGNYAWLMALFHAIIGIPPSVRSYILFIIKLIIRVISWLLFILLVVVSSHTPFLKGYANDLLPIACQYTSIPYYCKTNWKNPPFQNKTNLSIYNNSIPIDSYNVLFDIPSILAIKEGWEIKTDGSPFSSMFLNLEALYHKIMVAMIGDYNSGKTFLMNLLEKKNFNSSYEYATPAFGFVESSIYPYFYMDTQGLKRLASSSTNSGTNPHSIKDIKAIDNLISQSYKVADIIIELRDTGNNEDICNTQQRHSEYLHDKNKKTVVVVHNFKNLETVSEVERFIRDDITNPEIKGQLTISSAPGTIGCPFWHVDSVFHFVLAKQGSEAGDVYNQCTIDLIRSSILVNKPGIPKVNFLYKLLQIFEQSLSNYIKDPNVSEDSFFKVKKDETLYSIRDSIRDGIKNIFNFKFYSPSKPNAEEPFKIETHQFKVKIDNNKIKLENTSFNLEFSYKDSCGFKNIDYTPQYDVIETSNSYGIAIDVPNSIVNWYCSTTSSNKIYVNIERKDPTYLSSQVIRNINPRTYGKIFKWFDIPTKPWINCNNLVPTAKYQDGVAFVSLSESNDISIGSPFPNEENN